jgi:hypothetical protein
MELSTIIVGLIIIVVCAIPFVWMNLHNKGKHKEFRNLFNELASIHGSAVIQYDAWKQAAIGIDAKGDRIYFVRKKTDGDTHIEIELADIQKCCDSVATRSVSAQSLSTSVTDRVILSFVPKAKGNQEIMLEFYNVEFDSLMLRNEARMADKWSRIVNDKIALINSK